MTRRLFAAHAAVVYAFLYLPIVVVAIFAFNGGRQVLNWGGLSTRWFGVALHDQTITGPLRTSAEIALVNAAIAALLGTALALAVARMPRVLRLPIDVLVYTTLVTPEIVFAIAALVFFSQTGIALGAGTVVVSHVVYNASIVMLIVRARAAGMGSTLEEASFDLGAGPVATFRQVTLPRLTPAILAGSLLAFTFSWDDVITSFFVSGAGTTTLPLRIFSALRFGISPELNAVAVMIMAVTFGAILTAYLVVRRGERRGVQSAGALFGR